MSQPVDRVYVEILPDVKGFDRALAQQIKTKTERMFSDVTVPQRQRAVQAQEEAAVRRESRARRAARATGRAGRGFVQGLGGNVRGRSTPAQMAGEIVSAPFRLARGTLSTVGNFWDDLVSSMEAARFVGIGLAAVMGGRLALALGASLPLAAGVAAASLGTLMLGFQGTSKARDRFDAEMESLKPTFDEIRNEASRGLFQGFEGEITRVTENLKGPVKEGVFEVGQAWQFVAKGVTEYLSSARGAEVVNHVFDTTARLLRQWRPAVDSMMEGLGDLTIKATPFVERLNKRLSEGVTNFFDKIQEMADDGSLEKFFKDAIDDGAAFIQLLGDAKDIAKDIGQLLPTDLLQSLAERSRRSEGREAIEAAQGTGQQGQKVWEEAYRRLAKEGTGAKFEAPSWLEKAIPGQEGEVEQAIFDSIQDVIRQSATLRSAVGIDLESARNQFIFFYDEMQKAGLETDKIWDGLVTVNQERAAQLFLEFSESNTMAANDFRDSWLEKNNINREEWDKFLAANKEKLTKEQEDALSAQYTKNENEKAGLAQSNANQSAARGESLGGWSGFWSSMRGMASNAWETIKTTNATGIAGFLAGFSNARAQGQGIFSSLWSGIVSGAQAAWNNVKRIWSNDPVSTRWVAPAASSGGGGGSVGWADVKGYAHGGIFTGPTAALIGEAGDELAFPLTGSQGRTAMDQLAAAMARNNEINGGGGGGGAVGTGPGVRMWGNQGITVNSNLVVDSGGTSLDDLIVEILARVVRDRGGSVQQVFGGNSFAGGMA